MNEFVQWMELNTDLSTKSIKNYLQGIKTIDEELISKNMVQLGLKEVKTVKELEQLKIQYFDIPEFKDRDIRGNGMYSAAFNKYISYRDNKPTTKMSLEGIVYILSNPSLPGLVKIGQTTDIKRRLSDLFNTSVPTPFKCIYAKKVDNYKEVERKLHKGLNKDRVNQNREFFRIPEEEVINFLELVPGEDVTPKSESFEDKVDEVAFETQSRIGLKFNFLSADIKKGSILTFLDDESVTCKVMSNTKVEFEGEEHSLSSAALIAKNRLGFKWKTIAGPLKWIYEGETVDARRQRLENE